MTTQHNFWKKPEYWGVEPKQKAWQPTTQFGMFLFALVVLILKICIRIGIVASGIWIYFHWFA